MATVQTVTGDLLIRGSISVTGRATVSSGISRASLDTEEQRLYWIPFTRWRVWDAVATNLPGTAATDDLGFTAGAFGTGAPYLVSRDLNALGATTAYARAQIEIPPEYVGASGAGGTVTISAGMINAVASVSATVDVEAYKLGFNTNYSGTDLVTTTAQTINSTTFANLAFALSDAVSLENGDVLDIRITVAANSATASSHFAAIASTGLLFTIRG